MERKYINSMVRHMNNKMQNITMEMVNIESKADVDTTYLLNQIEQLKAYANELAQELTETNE